MLAMSQSDDERERALLQMRRALLTVKEYSDLTREHPLSVYRRIRENRQAGVVRIGGSIRLRPPSGE